MKKLLILALAATASLELIPTSEASASEPSARPQAAQVALPTTISENYIIIREGGRRYYVRRRYYRFHGRRRFDVVRVYL